MKIGLHCEVAFAPISHRTELGEKGGGIYTGIISETKSLVKVYYRHCWPTPVMILQLFVILPIYNLRCDNAVIRHNGSEDFQRHKGVLMLIHLLGTEYLLFSSIGQILLTLQLISFRHEIGPSCMSIKSHSYSERSNALSTTGSRSVNSCSKHYNLAETLRPEVRVNRLWRWVAKGLLRL